MNDDTTAAPRRSVDGPGPSFATPVEPSTADVPQGAAPVPGAAAEPGAPVEHEWTPDGLVSKPALPPERVGRGAALALLAIPAGAVVAGIIAELGYIATISSVVTAALAAILYARGSGGRVKKGIPVIALTIVVGLAVSFFASLAVQLWKAFPTLDPEVVAGYTRSSFVTANLFYPPIVGEAAKDATLFIVLGVVVGFGTIARLLRVSRA